MPKPRIALIVGAGFSTESGLPPTNKLSDQFLATPDGVVPPQVEQEISRHLREFWEKVFRFTDGKSKPHLEDHFTVIDLAANTGHHLGPAYSPRKLRAIRRFSIHRAFQILNLKYRPSKTIECLLAKLHEQADVSIVSANWDVVVENHFHALGQTYDYGGTVEPLSGYVADGNPSTPLRKLHGSANWVYCDSCRTLFSGPPGGGKDALHMRAFLETDDFEILGSPNEIVQLVRNLPRDGRECRICGCEVTARVGTFSYRKDYAIQQFQTIWRQAFDSLRASDTWLFVGYSMPEADFEFKQILKSAELATRESSRKRIQVILKDGPAERYQRFFGLGEDSISQVGLKKWVNKNFDNWLCKEVRT